jgi:hypothetical protein
MTDKTQQSLDRAFDAGLSSTEGKPAQAYSPRCTHVGFELRCLLPPDHSGGCDYGPSTDLVSELQRLREENQALRNLADNLQPGPISVALGGAAHEQPYREAAQAFRPAETASVQAVEELPADKSGRLGDGQASNRPCTAEQAMKMRDALRNIDQILESSKWYDGEDARELLLERLGSIVQGALP